MYRVIGLIEKFKQEFVKYNSEVDNLGKRIKLTSEQYEKVSGVRARQLMKIMDQIEEEKTIEKEKEDKKLTE